MSLENVIYEAIADALSKQLEPLLQPFLGKLNISDKGAAEDFLTTPEAANLLKVSPITMEIWRHKRCGPNFVHIGNGRSVRYKRSVLLAFLQNNTGLIGKRGRPLKVQVVKTSGVIRGYRAKEVA